jgi:hypothetical protein
MDRIENDFARFWIKNGIMYGEYKPNVLIDFEAAKKVASDRIFLSQNKPLPNLAFIGGLNTVTKEARDFFSKGDGTKCIKKLALITGSPISKMVGNFYLQISKPMNPTRLFTTEDDAVKWLKED